MLAVSAWATAWADALMLSTVRSIESSTATGAGRGVAAGRGAGAGGGGKAGAGVGRGVGAGAEAKVGVAVGVGAGAGAGVGATAAGAVAAAAATAAADLRRSPWALAGVCALAGAGETGASTGGADSGAAAGGDSTSGTGAATALADLRAVGFLVATLGIDINYMFGWRPDSDCQRQCEVKVLPHWTGCVRKSSK
jgi:hypothetical protein